MFEFVSRNFDRRVSRSDTSIDIVNLSSSNHPISKKLYRLQDCSIKLLQKVEVLNKRKNRKFVVTCDLLYQTDETGGTSHSKVTIPSFSSVLYMDDGMPRVCIIGAIIWIEFVEGGRKEKRIRFLGAPLRTIEQARMETYLPYTTVEHDSYNGGVKVVMIRSLDIIDTHFVFPVFGLRNMWSRLDSLPEGTTFNTRGGTRAYFSFPFSRYDVASAKWANDEDWYYRILRPDQAKFRPPNSEKVFLSTAELEDRETYFGLATPRGLDHAIIGRPTRAGSIDDADDDSFVASDRSHEVSDDDIDSIGEYEYDTESICSEV